MLFDGKLDAVDLVAIEETARENDLKRVVKHIKLHYNIGTSIDADELASELGIKKLSRREIEKIERELNK